MNNLLRIAVDNVVGRRVLRAKAGHGSMIDLIFANSEEESGEEWGIWIQHPMWRIENSRIIVLSSAFDERNSFVNGVKILREINYNGHFYDTDFVFDEGIILSTFAFREESSDLVSWQLFAPDLNVLSVGPGKKIHYGRTDSTDD